MERKTEQGSILAVTLIVLAVVAVAAAGWFVWKKNATRDNKTTGELTSQKEEKQEKTKYLVIKEWNVKLPLTKEIEGAYYIFESTEEIDYVSVYDVGFDDLKNANGVSCGGENKFQLFSMSRVKKGSRAASEIDNFYRGFSFSDDYLFGGLAAHQAPPPCADLNPEGDFNGDPNILDAEAKKKEAFRKELEHLQSLE